MSTRWTRRVVGLVVALVVLGLASGAFAQGSAATAASAGATNAFAIPSGLQVKFDAATSPAEFSQSIKIMFLLTALSLAPSLFVMCTSFTRILIVLGIFRQALGLQSVPPGQVLSGMALFLTMFTMAPVWEQMNRDAIQPYMEERITQEEALDKGLAPVKTFMLRQTGDSELNLFFELAGKAAPKTRAIDEVPLHILIPAFMISELKTAMEMAFLVYLPFLMIDMVVASSLMSLGMMMLPPMMISLPIKILLFVLADGWVLLMRGLVTSFTP